MSHYKYTCMTRFILAAFIPALLTSCIRGKIDQRHVESCQLCGSVPKGESKIVQQNNGLIFGVFATS